MYKSTKIVTLVALSIALCVIGADITIFQSIAFDSFPAFALALIIGPRYGAVVAALGHMITASLHGFPFSIPVHAITACMMAIAAMSFGLCYRQWKFPYGLLIGFAVAYLWNVPLALGVLAGLALLPWSLLPILAPILSLATLANLVLGYFVATIWIRIFK